MGLGTRLVRATKTYGKQFSRVSVVLGSFAAVVGLVTQRNAPGEERCVASLKTAAKKATVVQFMQQRIMGQMKRLVNA